MLPGPTDDVKPVPASWPGSHAGDTFRGRAWVLKSAVGFSTWTGKERVVALWGTVGNDHGWRCEEMEEALAVFPLRPRMAWSAQAWLWSSRQKQRQGLCCG